MTDIIDEIKLVIPAQRKRSPSGWDNFCCPACGDRRYRGGFKFTDTGGFRYYCHNGGCEFNLRPTGWEPGNGFGGRPRRIFEMLGGDIKSIPLTEIMRWSTQRYNSSGQEIEPGNKLDVAWQFPSMRLPKDTQLLMDVNQREPAANKVMEYLVKERRLGPLVKDLPIMWSPDEAYYFLIPFIHYNEKVVGYLGRHIFRKKGPKRFIGKAPADYMFNQHLISTYKARYLFVVESPLEAMLLGCVASRGDRLTERQVNLLKVSGKDIVLVPDRKKGEWVGYLDIAKKEDWFVSVPRGTGTETWEREDDISDMVARNGLLFTIEELMASATRNYKKVEVTMKQRNT